MPSQPTEAPDVLFLHGLFGVPDHWEPIARSLGDAYRTHLLDLDLFGRPLDQTSVAPVVDSVAAYLDDHGIDRFVAVGNSLGGQVGLHLALRMPDRVVGLMLAGSSGLMERGLDQAPRRPSREWIRERVEEIFFEPPAITDALVDRVTGIISDTDSARRLVRMARATKQDDVGRHLERITCPVALFWGEDDSVTPADVAREFHRRLPNAELTLVPRCGHVPMLEHPDAFAAALAQFLESRRLPADR